MSYSNERIITQLRQDGTAWVSVRVLEALDHEIDSILRAGGTSRDVRSTQRRFNDLLAEVQSIAAGESTSVRVHQ